MSDLETARVIALNLLRGRDLPDEAGVKRTAEIAVQALMAQVPGTEVDVDSLTRELEDEPQRGRGAGIDAHG